jgi:mono/diheme cytochrome c family protein
MKKAWLSVGLVAMLCGPPAIVSAQDAASGEKLFKAKCAGCHGTDAAGKPAMKSPSVKGKSADQIQQVISTSSKHKSLKKLTSDDVKNIGAYLGTLK